MQARVENARKCILSHKFGYPPNPKSPHFPSHPFDQFLSSSSSSETLVPVTSHTHRCHSTLNLNPCSLRPGFLGFPLVPIDSPHKNSIFAQNSISKPTCLHSLSFPFHSVSNPNPSSPASRNPNPNYLHFPSSSRSMNPTPACVHSLLRLFRSHSTLSPPMHSSLSTRKLAICINSTSLVRSINLDLIPNLYVSAESCNCIFKSLNSIFCCFRLFSTSSRMPSGAPISCRQKPDSRNISGKLNPSSRASGRNVESRVLGINPDEVRDIIDLIKSEANDMESKLSLMNLRLSHVLVSEILLVLSNHGVSALRFFQWVLNTHPNFKLNSEIYDRMIDNFGRLDDYRVMFLVLNELSSKGHCLTEKAFIFLTLCSSDTAKDSIKRTIETLDRVRGSCRGSGIHSLIKLLCALNSFNLAIFVMEITARKTSYYNVLIAAKCRNGDFQEAHDLFDEMKRFGCDPNTKSYNYLLGSLFKNKRIAEACELLQAMEEFGYLPNTVTFEVVIVHACKANRMDFAVEFLNRMLSEGLRPRMTTHAAFIKGYFSSGRVADAYKYVVDTNTKDKCSGNMNYSLLASLFQMSGKVVEAGGVLHEMMEKGLKPNFPVYMRVIKDLQKLIRGDLALELKFMFSKFNSSTDAG